MDIDIKNYLEERRELVERELQALMLSSGGPFARHIEAMRYSLFSGGKRLRPIICLAAAEAACAPDIPAEEARKRALPAACALECIHTYSLIHDDLPAMDDDDLRRGRPTNHKFFGEAAAILAGDGLLTWAFDILSGEAAKHLPEKSRLAIIQVIARAAGPLGMVGGQSLDMIWQGKKGDYEALRTIHQSKTAALIVASLASGAIAVGADRARLAALREYGEQAGLAFQIVDDLLDLTATPEELGKTPGKDVTAGKLTFPAIFTVETSEIMARDAVKAAVKAIAGFDERADPLRALARYIIERRV